MRRWSLLLANAFVAFHFLAAAEEELPAPDPDQPLEIEPPLLIRNRAPDGSLIVPNQNAPASDAALDPAKLETDLARAKKNAAAGERLYRAGIIAKVEAEERALKVVRLVAKLAQAQLEQAKLQQDGSATDKLAAVEKAAAQAAEEKQRAELQAAIRNLQRQQKLLARGSGRKSDVNRAARKLAELQNPTN